MDVKLPDGTVIRNVPEGTTQSELMARLQKARAQPAAEQVANDPISQGAHAQNITPAEWLAGTPPMRFAAGAAAPFVGAAQLLGNLGGQGDNEKNLFSNQRVQQMDEMKRKGMAASGDETDVAGFAGQMLSPASMAALKMAPAASTLGRVKQGAALGAAFGAAEPVTGGDYANSKAMQVAGGAAVGGAIPALWEGGKAVGRGLRNIVQPYLGEWGADRAAGRLGNIAAGDRKQALIAELERATPAIPGAPMSAGQAAEPVGSREFSALQKISEKKAPTLYGELEDAQNAARLAAVRSVGQTPQDLMIAEMSRGNVARHNYESAFNTAIRADPELAKMAANPYFKSALPDAFKLAEAKGVDPKKDLTQFLHFVKLSLDKDLTRSGDAALNTTEKRTIQGLQGDLVGWLANKNPSYEVARQRFADMSQPINQMTAGQSLERNLLPALSENAKQKAEAYARGMRDTDLSSLRPDQLTTLNQVQTDLAKNASLDQMARAGVPRALDMIGMAAPQQGTIGLFNPKISAARAVYNRISGQATDKILEDFAKNATNPQKIAQMMKDATPYKRQLMVDYMMRLQAPATAALQGEQQ